MLEYSASDDEAPLLFSPYPLHDFICGIRHSRTSRRCWRYGVQFEQRRTPRQCNVGRGRFVMDLERRRFGMERGLEVCVEEEESGILMSALKF